MILLLFIKIILFFLSFVLFYLFEFLHKNELIATVDVPHLVGLLVWACCDEMN